MTWWRVSRRKKRSRQERLVRRDDFDEVGGDLADRRSRWRHVPSPGRELVLRRWLLRRGRRAVAGGGDASERSDERVGAGAVPREDEAAGRHIG